VRRSIDGYTSAGKYLGPRTFGHTGFTGTSLWIDPDQNLFVALLTNAVHPTAVIDQSS
jgi:CubicO group peptidase (beta-lactamase class C family)